MASPALRLCLFTDTLGDVNGVSRFVQNIAGEAARTGRQLHVLTSTNRPIPAQPNIHNISPLLAGAMPGYRDLDLVLPPAAALFTAARRLAPDAVHISTPGPVGMVGLAVAKALGVPIMGVYHTDFPAYIDRLFDNPSFTWMSRISMRAFYKRFAAIFTRSEAYARSLASLGIAPDRLVTLQAGVDLTAFHPRYRSPAVWKSAGGPSLTAPKVLYVGRVSVEKNLPLLVDTWRKVRQMLADESRSGQLNASPPQLVIVGDGPYRASMEQQLAGDDVHYLGFRHGHELSAIYATSDLFVFPSTTDTLGQVVIEAQASGLPALVSDVGGPREIVRSGITGHVLPAGSADAPKWARAIVSLVRDPERRVAMGTAAQRAAGSLSIGASFEHFWQVHEQVARRPVHQRRLMRLSPA